MKTFDRVSHCAFVCSLAWAATANGILATGLDAAELSAAPTNAVVAQQAFASPAEAMAALQAVMQTGDEAGMNKIFGPQFRELQTGDHVQDTNNAQRFARAMALGCKPMPEGNDKIVFEVGTNNWPMPIPLVRTNGQWMFDTAAGKEEIINRHIGKDELHAIGVCRAYVAAQRLYGRLNLVSGGSTNYAQRFKSTPGKKDGLFWPATGNEPESPFGPLVAKAQMEGYGAKTGTGTKPFHGYFFRVLTRQGRSAPGGKMDYLRDGNLTDGFALVAYPAVWDQSGIMTFIVNQDGKVFQRNLGEDTAQVVNRMNEYNPDHNWTLVQDPGVVNAACEK